MANPTQQPLLNPLPQLEPPSFGPLRDLLSMKILQEQGNPYGYDPSKGQSTASLWTGYGRQPFDPYGGGGGMGGGGNILQLIQQLLGQMGGGRQPQPVGPRPGFTPPTPTEGSQPPGSIFPMGGPTQAPMPTESSQPPGMLFGGGGMQARPKSAGAYGFDGRCAMGHDGCMGHDMADDWSGRKQLTPGAPGQGGAGTPHSVNPYAPASNPGSWGTPFNPGRGPVMPAPRPTPRPVGPGPGGAVGGAWMPRGRGPMPTPGSPTGMLGLDAGVRPPMVGPQPGGIRPMMPPRGRTSSPAHRAIMAALMQRIAAQRRPPAGPPVNPAMLMGRDSPYMFQRGPMSPLGMDAPPQVDPWNQATKQWLQMNPGDHGAFGSTPNPNATPMGLETTMSAGQPPKTGFSGAAPWATAPRSAPGTAPQPKPWDSITSQWLAMNPGPHGSAGSIPQNFTPYGMEGFMSGQFASPSGHDGV